MNRCDFSSVSKIILNYISAKEAISQVDYVYNLFSFFEAEHMEYEYDFGQISRWVNGAASVSPKIIAYYCKDNNSDYFRTDMIKRIIPLMYDPAMAAQDIYDLVISDMSISENKRNELTRMFSNDNTESIADFITKILIFSLERKFEKHNTKSIAAGTLSPVVSDIIFDGDLPKPCKYFCGRDSELDELHNILLDHNKVFIRGIAGIGKSEYVKAYAFKHRKEYTNILYFAYTGSLQTMIAEMDFADDRPDEDMQARFKKHNRFLRSLKPDTLIIIDNFNTSASSEALLDVIMKYNCRVIFTTRSRFECGYTYELNEIEDIEALVNLAENFYSGTENHREVILNIIETVHRHTLSVEMAARLLQKGILEPDELLEKLAENSVNPETSDKIGITKDGVSSKATYYNHLRTLFSLFSLSSEMQKIMRCMVFVPENGVRAKMFAKWLELFDLNDINDLTELGFIQNTEVDKITILPMVRDIAVEDLKPSYSNCQTFIDSIHRICIKRGEDITYYHTLFAVVENITSYIIKDSIPDYLLFIEDAFAYMEKYRYSSGMNRIVSEMSEILNDPEAGNENDRALLLNNKASCEGLLNGNYKKAIELEKKAIATCFPENNLVLAANLYMNLGFLYQCAKNFDNAKIYMRQGMDLIAESGVITNDIITMSRNYARLLAETGEPNNAIKAMKKCAEMVRTVNSDNCIDYADLCFDIAGILIQQGSSDLAKEYFIKAFKIYSSVFKEDDMQEKYFMAVKYYSQAKITDIPDYLALH